MSVILRGAITGNLAEVNSSNEMKVALSAMPSVTGTVAVSNFPATQPVSGSVLVSNLPATQPVSGTLAVSSIPSIPAGSAAIGSVSVSNFPSTQAVTLATLPALAAGSAAIGSVSVSNFPATQPVSGTVGVSSLPAIPAGANAIGSVSVSNFPATQPISAASLPLPTGAATSALQTTLNTAIGSPFQAGGSIGNSSFASTQSGTWNITNVSGTVSLPTGAATAALQTTIDTDIKASQPRKMQDGAGNSLASSTSAPAGTEQALITRNIPSGTQPVSLAALPSLSTGTNAIGSVLIKDSSGNTGGVTTDGAIYNQPPSGTLLSENFDSAGLDTNIWTLTTSGGMTQSQSGGLCTLTGNTTASASVSLVSTFSIKTNFSTLSAGFLIKSDPTQASNAHRFWGVGTVPGSWTAATPLYDAIGFEIDTSGNFSAVVYSVGTKVFTFNLNSYKTALGAATNLLAIAIRADNFEFYVDNQFTPITTASLIAVDSLALPIRMHMINGTTPPGTAPILYVASAGLGDTNPSNTNQLSDATYPWRKLAISATGAATIAGNVASGASDSGNPIKVGGVYKASGLTLTDGQRGDLQLDTAARIIAVQGTRITYMMATGPFAPSSFATDMVTISGSATKIVKVLKITFTSNQNTSGINNIFLVKRSSANSGGTSATQTNIPMDSTNAAASAVTRLYSANPTGLGTLVGNLDVVKVQSPAGTSPTTNAYYWWNFEETRSAQPPTLHGTSESLAINFGGNAVPGALSIAASIVWSEE